MTSNTPTRVIPGRSPSTPPAAPQSSAPSRPPLPTISFHLAWLSLFTCFFSAFAVPPPLRVLRDSLTLTSSEISLSAVYSAAGTILGRLLMGPACDLLGPRLASAASTLLSAPPIFVLASTASFARSFHLLRSLSGFSLAAFVSNQYWISSMFSPSIIGLANAVSTGWANIGSAAAQFLIPFIFSGFSYLPGLESFSAWRAAFFLPTALQVATSLAVLEFGHDLPNPTNINIHKKRQLPLGQVLEDGILNYRGWILGLTYGYCYGVELTMENIVAEYFYDRFGLGLKAAGIVAAGFGVVNLVARPGGGMVSDEMGRRSGMRGKLWGLWIVQSLGGVLCLVMGRMGSLGSSVAAMVGVSVFVQAASGMTFGVVPFVSKRFVGALVLRFFPSFWQLSSKF